VLISTARLDTFAAMKNVAVHDHSYKLLFSHARMVRDLLEGFIGGEWLTAVDFATLERVSDAYVTDDLRARADDIVWRVRCGQHDVYLLLEFQSTVEPFMAVRVLTYVGLLYQDLIKARTVSRDALLPNVVPVVLYNGTPRWRAACDVAALLCDSPNGLDEYRPTLRYLLIDEGEYDEQRLARDDNLVAMLFRLENCFDRDRVKSLVKALAERRGSTELQSLRRAFAVWLNRVISVRFADESINNLLEATSMLADRVPIWEEELRQEGQSRMLSHLLNRRFGALPASVDAELRAANCDQLQHWGDRLLAGASLNEIFGTAG
jgi:hypothetical protein